eukprot:tig00000382_g24552.t1
MGPPAEEIRHLIKQARPQDDFQVSRLDPTPVNIIYGPFDKSVTIKSACFFLADSSEGLLVGTAVESVEDVRVEVRWGLAEGEEMDSLWRLTLAASGQGKTLYECLAYPKEEEQGQAVDHARDEQPEAVFPFFSVARAGSKLTVSFCVVSNEGLRDMNAKKLGLAFYLACSNPAGERSFPKPFPQTNYFVDVSLEQLARRRLLNGASMDEMANQLAAMNEKILRLTHELAEQAHKEEQLQESQRSLEAVRRRLEEFMRAQQLDKENRPPPGEAQGAVTPSRVRNLAQPQHAGPAAGSPLQARASPLQARMPGPATPRRPQAMAHDDRLQVEAEARARAEARASAEAENARRMEAARDEKERELTAERAHANDLHDQLAVIQRRLDEATRRIKEMEDAQGATRQAIQEMKASRDNFQQQLATERERADNAVTARDNFQQKAATERTRADKTEEENAVLKSKIKSMSQPQPVPAKPSTFKQLLKYAFAVAVAVLGALLILSMGPEASFGVKDPSSGTLRLGLTLSLHSRLTTAPPDNKTLPFEFFLTDAAGVMGVPTYLTGGELLLGEALRTCYLHPLSLPPPPPPPSFSGTSTSDSTSGSTSGSTGSSGSGSDSTSGSTGGSHSSRPATPEAPVIQNASSCEESARNFSQQEQEAGGHLDAARHHSESAPHHPATTLATTASGFEGERLGGRPAPRPPRLQLPPVATSVLRKMAGEPRRPATACRASVPPGEPRRRPPRLRTARAPPGEPRRRPPRLRTAPDPARRAARAAACRTSAPPGEPRRRLPRLRTAPGPPVKPRRRATQSGVRLRPSRRAAVEHVAPPRAPGPARRAAARSRHASAPRGEPFRRPARLRPARRAAPPPAATPVRPTSRAAALRASTRPARRPALFRCHPMSLLPAAKRHAGMPASVREGGAARADADGAQEHFEHVAAGSC